MALGKDFVEKYGPWALVTGASSGIGAEFARQLSGAGLNIILVARRKERLDELSRDIEKKHDVQTRVIAADISKSDAAISISDQVKDLDIGLLVNNAGVATIGSFFKDSAEAHANVIAVNVNGPVALTRAICPLLIDRKRGGVINVSSAASKPVPYQAIYSASKAFLTNFSVIIADELKPYGIDVLTVEPGIVTTEMSMRIKEAVDLSKFGFPSMTAEEAVRVILPQLGKTDLYIPGFFNRALMILVSILPRRAIFAMMGPRIASQLKPEKLLNG